MRRNVTSESIPLAIDENDPTEFEYTKLILQHRDMQFLIIQF